MIEVPKRKPCQPFLLFLVATPHMSGSRAGWKLVLPTKRERYEALHKKAYFHYSQMSVGSKDRQGPTLGVYLIHVSVKRAGVDCILMRLFASHRIHSWSITEECRGRVFHLFCRKEWFSIYELCCTQAEIKETYEQNISYFRKWPEKIS